MKKTLKIIGIAILLLLIFRGFIYRHTIHYTPIKTKPIIALTNKRIISEVEEIIKNQKLDIGKIALVAAAITKDYLQFTFKKSSNNPNKIALTQKANCVGYAAFFNAIVHYIIQKKGLPDRYQSRHLVGKLDFLGVDLHQFFTDPFYLNHDYVIIEDKNSNRKLLIDPSIDDYFRVGPIKIN